ncbi:MAG: tetratricopeptide repeat protein [Desulfurellaceae bacterium]|nr:tetratricopeptide repeat protein [Desulfurellaceae bacterium]
MKPICRLLIYITLLWACVGARSVTAEDVDVANCSVTDLMISAEQAEQVAACRVAAESGNANAQFGLGFMYDDFGMGVVPKDYAEAMRWYRRAAEQGHAKAQIQIGFMYERGNGVPVNEAEATAWFRLAAEQGDAEGQFKLGLQYYYGEGVLQDYAQAVAWFRLAADQGNVWAQFNLGTVYYYGQGVPQDYTLAHMWFNLAGTDTFYELARESRDTVAKQMTPAQLAEAQRLAREWTAAHRAGVE